MAAQVFREVEKRVIMVEGESDTQTLWFLGLPGLGVPGASTFKPEWCERLKAIDALYLHIEPDQGGETFLQQMAQKLHDGGYTGKVYRWSCGEYGEKDPSALFIKYGKEEAAAKIRASLDNAAPLDLARLTETIPTAVEGAPIRLRQPEGWIFSERASAPSTKRPPPPMSSAAPPSSSPAACGAWRPGTRRSRWLSSATASGTASYSPARSSSRAGASPPWPTRE